MDVNKQKIITDFTQKQVTYFSKNYGNSRKKNFIRNLRRELILLQVLPHSKSARVLDAGSGPAILYTELLKDCQSYLALDITPSNLEQISKQFNHPLISLQCSDLDTLNWEGAPFTIIICSGSLEYTASPAKNFKKLLSYLGQDGILVASFPNQYSPYRIWNKYVYSCMKRVLNKSKGTYKRSHLTPSILISEIDTAKYEFIVQYFGHRLLPQPIDALLKRLDNYLTKLFTRKKIKALNWICVEFLVVVRLKGSSNKFHNVVVQ